MSDLGVHHLLPLNNGSKIHALGFGTWQAAPGEVAASLRTALDSGFRHFDCARIYRNEAEIGQVFEEYLSKGAVERADLYVTSKLWNTDHSPEDVEVACRATLTDLRLTYLDLYLIHWPVSFAHPKEYTKDSDWLPRNDAGGIHQSNVPLAATWEAMERLVDAGLVRSIGVSNVSAEQLRDLCRTCRIKPVVNQVEIHPALPQVELQQSCAENGVLLQAYCPLGVGMIVGGKALNPKSLLTEPEIVRIASEAGLSAAQLLLRWNLQRGNIVLTKSVTPNRIADAAATPYGGLSAATMAALQEYGAKNPYRFVNPNFFYETPRPFFAD